MSSVSVYQRHADKVTALSNRLTKYKVSLAEVVFDLSFVANFIVGKLIHVFSQEEEIYNYYNNKGNFFNQWFVKKGWGWTTAAILVFYVVHLQKSPHNRVKIALGAISRWAIATFWWVLFTQWCFGLPIMDKVFVLTGGKCASIPTTTVTTGFNGLNRAFYLVGENYESVSVTSYNCRKMKGSWEGGHDPSGHVFLLVHASLYLFHEIRQFWPGWEEFISHAKETALVREIAVKQRVKSAVWALPHAPIMLLLALWWFMLLVTNMYFHSLAEKLVGLAFGYMGVIVVYYAPRYLLKDVWREKADVKND
ncbi:hypothetical protein OY671_007196 [Metschnikowia pulcherrima]|nr:hypothetical protein OY671_007196 [Metschnikowia pulcherrima]